MIAACAASRGWRKDGEAANEASREYVIVNSAGFEACRGERVKHLKYCVLHFTAAYGILNPGWLFVNNYGTPRNSH